MILPISLHPLAQRELNESTDYYSDISPSLANRFLDDFDDAAKFIGDNPRAAGLIDRDVRRKLFRKFPFTIFYSLRPDSIRILAIAHQSRRPFYWRGRS